MAGRTGPETLALTMWSGNWLAFGSVRKRRRRCALPPHSISCAVAGRLVNSCLLAGFAIQTENGEGRMRNGSDLRLGA